MENFTCWYQGTNNVWLSDILQGYSVSFKGSDLVKQENVRSTAFTIRGQQRTSNLWNCISRKLKEVNERSFLFPFLILIKVAATYIWYPISWPLPHVNKIDKFNLLDRPVNYRAIARLWFLVVPVSVWAGDSQQHGTFVCNFGNKISTFIN